jgi:hypothetical protein
LADKGILIGVMRKKGSIILDSSLRLNHMAKVAVAGGAGFIDSILTRTPWLD